MPQSDHSNHSFPSIAIVGATGAVGREMLSVIEQRRFPCRELRLLASSRSAGTTIEYRGQPLTVGELTDDSFDGIDLALFSAGGSVSKQYAPIAVARGATVIDNSSAFRMNDDVPLIVPEINDDVLEDFDFPDKAGIIANPNCSTIIALMAVTPLYDAVGIERMVISTYQAVSGAGAAWMAELEQQARDFAIGQPLTSEVTGRQCLFNVFNHNSPIGEDGYNTEETKMVKETHKIWGDDTVAISATCVRVPVLRAHCESINLTFRKALYEDEAREILASAPGVRVVDDRAGNKFPEPIDASSIDEVLVGRIRADYSQPDGMGLNLFVAGDQLRKGAALNAVQIAEKLMERQAATV
ncbi:MAG: aspartate-semialdehyde dehydrogenase [Phycisphaerales bacterium]|nr:aspartate-semialdehyde dehydrogenase [Phycisphaerales bacterium]MCI0630864.1 aspartate-semialdehyde dehydrogenase [Phycisphaerales bacterium]MCI0675253.1 aspartate-semialdehyde dehydrogenase [Phycisphaerales bacterium]